MSYDCPLVPDVSRLMSWLAGASVAAARAIAEGHVKRAINWGGGGHHSQRDNASGFCEFVNVLDTLHVMFHKWLLQATSMTSYWQFMR